MIAATDLRQLMNQARVTLVGASDAGLKGAFYDVCSEFLNDSSAWTQDIKFNATPDKRLYTFTPNEGQIIRLVGVSTLPAALSDPCLPVPALMEEVGKVLLANAPQTATTYVATFVTNVSLPTDKNDVPLGPDWLLPIWHVGLLDGLLGKMMLQPGKSYSNVQTGTYHLKRFRDVIQRARVSKLRANTVGTQAWRFPQSFRANNQQGGVPAVGSTRDRSF